MNVEGIVEGKLRGSAGCHKVSIEVSHDHDELWVPVVFVHVDGLPARATD